MRLMQRDHRHTVWMEEHGMSGEAKPARQQSDVLFITSSWKLEV